MRLKPRTHFTKYRFTTEMGDVFETNSLALFCKEFNLNRPSITNLSKGRLRTYKGFRFVGKDVANFVMTNTETGEDHKVMAIVPFAKENKIDVATIYHIVRGVSVKYKHWKAKEIPLDSEVEAYVKRIV